MTRKRHKLSRKIWSWRDVLKVLQKICYCVVNQKGSHITLFPKCASVKERNLPLTVPKHRELKHRTFNSILAKTNLSKAEFYEIWSDP